jgi:hypothetical protein
MGQPYDNSKVLLMANIPSGMFTRFLANISWSSVLMKKAPKISV